MSHENKVISLTFDWYLRNVLPVVCRIAPQSKLGYHGLYTHTSAVVFRGIDYALSLSKNPKPVVLACAFHDMARTDDGPDLTHGENAIPMVNAIFRDCIPVPQPYRDSIIYAVKNHTIGTVAPDYISACLWDADRTRLAWEMGYDAQFFTTQRAKLVARSKYEVYLPFMKRNMSEYARKIITTLDKQY